MMRVVQTTSIMNTDLQKRKKLFHRPRKLRRLTVVGILHFCYIPVYVSCLGNAARCIKFWYLGNVLDRNVYFNSFSKIFISWKYIYNVGHFIWTGGTSTSASKSTNVSQKSLQQQNYQIPASALYETAEEPKASLASTQAVSSGRPGNGIYISWLINFGF